MERAKGLETTITGGASFEYALHDGLIKEGVRHSSTCGRISTFQNEEITAREMNGDVEEGMKPPLNHPPLMMSSAAGNDTHASATL